MEFLKSILNWVKTQLNKLTTLIGFGEFFTITKATKATESAKTSAEETKSEETILSNGKVEETTETVTEEVSEETTETDGLVAVTGKFKPDTPALRQAQMYMFGVMLSSIGYVGDKKSLRAVREDLFKRVPYMNGNDKAFKAWLEETFKHPEDVINYINQTPVIVKAHPASVRISRAAKAKK